MKYYMRRKGIYKRYIYNDIKWFLNGKFCKRFMAQPITVQIMEILLKTFMDEIANRLHNQVIDESINMLRMYKHHHVINLKVRFSYAFANLVCIKVFN